MRTPGAGVWTKLFPRIACIPNRDKAARRGPEDVQQKEKPRKKRAVCGTNGG